MLGTASSPSSASQQLRHLTKDPWACELGLAEGDGHDVVRIRWSLKSIGIAVARAFAQIQAVRMLVVELLEGSGATLLPRTILRRFQFP